jgi:response regulator NasT
MTTPSLRIAIADDEVRMREFLHETLESLGHNVVAVAETGRQLVDQCRESQPDLIVTDIKMPDMDGLDASTKISCERPTPVILVSAYYDDDYISRAMGDHVLAYLVKPIRSSDLEPAISLVMQRFKEFHALQQQAEDLRQALEDRKSIERAKGILMKRASLSEQDAFRRLQKLSSEKNKKMVEIAQTIIDGDAALH